MNNWSHLTPRPYDETHLKLQPKALRKLSPWALICLYHPKEQGVVLLCFILFEFPVHLSLCSGYSMPCVMYIACPCIVYIACPCVINAAGPCDLGQLSLPICFSLFSLVSSASHSLFLLKEYNCLTKM